MTPTLSALHRAVINSPTDRTVRLVYADALEETGEPTNLARAEFIRAQIELETAADDEDRVEGLSDRCAQLFEANWLAWWAPVADAAGLPRPRGRDKRVRDRISRALRPPVRRHADWPYTVTTGDSTVHLADYGLSFRFAGGFPEEVRFRHFDALEGGPELVHRWGDAIPLVRLSLSSDLSVTEWESVNGSHLARLTDLTLNSLLDGVAPSVAASPHLANLTRLAVDPVDPVGSSSRAVHALVTRPPWEKLRILRLTGRLSPDDVRHLASACTLRHLEELEVCIGNPGLLGGPVFEAAGAIVRAIARAVAHPVEAAPRWAPFGPALETLAAADWVRRLRTLRVTTGRGSGLLALISDRLHGQSMDVIPDAAVLALADAVRSDKLERLVLPAAILSPPVREELSRRMGSTIEFG